MNILDLLRLKEFAFCVCLIATSASASLHETNTLETCPPLGDTTIIVRLTSGLAFAVPFEGVDLSFPQSDPHGDLTMVPGCPENPFRSTVITAFGDFSGRVGKDTLDVIKAQGVYLMRISGIRSLTDKHRKDLEYFFTVAEYGMNCRETTEGLEICYQCREDEVRPGYCVAVEGRGVSSDGRAIERAGFEVRDADRLIGPDALPWVASCGSESTGGSRLCHVSYTLADGLNVSYRFGFGGVIGFDGVDVNRLRALDIAVQQAIQDLRVPEFDGADMR